MPTLSDEYVHASSWACAHFQVSNMCTLPVEHMHTLYVSLCTPDEHMHSYTSACAHFSWACAIFQLSMCTLSGEHVHTSSWVYARLHFSMHTLTLEHLHAYTWASSWACARSSWAWVHVFLRIHDHVHIYELEREVFSWLAVELALWRYHVCTFLHLKMWKFVAPIALENLPKERNK